MCHEKIEPMKKRVKQGKYNNKTLLCCAVAMHGHLASSKYGDLTKQLQTNKQYLRAVSNFVNLLSNGCKLPSYSLYYINEYKILGDVAS